MFVTHEVNVEEGMDYVGIAAKLAKEESQPFAHQI